MEISINGKPADITLESEKTLGDLLAGVEEWLSVSESRISGLQIDGQNINAVSLTEVFEKELTGIKQINITVSAWQELALEALYNALKTVQVYEQSSFSEKGDIKNNWESCPASSFLSEQMSDISKLMDSLFKGEGTADLIEKIIA